MSRKPEDKTPNLQTESHDVSMIAHELRSFFHCVKLSTTVLRTARTDEASFAEIIEIIERDHKRALPRLNELLDLVQSMSLENQPHPHPDRG